jgi:predicted ester cyclase
MRGFGTLADERETMELHRVAFPDKHTEIHWIVADEDTVDCFCTVSATTSTTSAGSALIHGTR